MPSEQFLQLALSTAESYRLGMEAQGSEGLVALIDALSFLLQNSPKVDSVRLGQVLTAMFEAQARRDYLYLVDLLQYEMLPLVHEV